ncbi:MAG: ABC transporter ATP-binding protein [Planctomycetota bacterium]|jgi:ABC-2 type transport system ATP-binding protein
MTQTENDTAPDHAATSPALRIRDLHHAFKGHKALDGVNFDVPAQTIHGFVGPNGAGKTTTLRIVSTLLPPQRGTVQVFGMSVTGAVKNVRRRIGFMPDHFSMYRQMTVFEYLDFFAAAYGQSLAERNRTIDDVLELTDMSGRRDDFIKGLSRGMQQRVSLARVLVHDPDILLLDEPASGLDPRARIELMEILRELQRMGKTVFISSHILSELATLCDTVTVIDRGKIKYTGPMSELLAHESGADVFELHLREADDSLAGVLAAANGVDEVQPIDNGRPGYILTLSPDADGPNDALRAAIDHGAHVVDFKRVTRHLNDAFMDLTEAGVRS